MYNNERKSQIITIPNLLSLFRLLLIPVYMILYLKAQEPQQFYTAGTILAISCLTDLIDGKIARHFHMVSIVGKILDPLADKITQFTLILCLALKHPVLNPVLAIFTVKEVLQLALGIFFLQQKKILPGALFAGKICTAVLFISMTALVFFPNAPGNTVKFIAISDALFLTISLLCYYLAYFGKHRKIQDI